MSVRLYFIDGPTVIGGEIVKEAIKEELFNKHAVIRQKKWIIHADSGLAEFVVASDNVARTGPWNNDNAQNWRKLCAGKSSNNSEQCRQIAEAIFEEAKSGAVVLCLGGYDKYTNLYTTIVHLFKNVCGTDGSMMCFVLHTVPSFTEAFNLLFSEIRAGISSIDNEEEKEILREVDDLINRNRSFLLNNWSSYHIAASHIFNSLGVSLPDHRDCFKDLPVSDICSGVISGNERGLTCKELPIVAKLYIEPKDDKDKFGGLVNYFANGIPPSINPWRRVVDVDAWKRVVEFEAIPPKS